MSSLIPQTRPTPTEIIQRVSHIRRAFSQAAAVPITARQKATTRDPGVKGPYWVSRIAYPAPPEKSIQEVLLDAIAELGDGTENFDVPEVGGLEAQWIGWRSDVGKDDPEAGGSERERYEGLMKEVESDITILYVYGGAFMVNGPHSCRATCGTLARLTGGRCYTVRYRLAPQHPFPAALLDIFHAYLTLISPPPDSFHAPIAPSSIVFAGDSSGACLLLSLVQVLLSFTRSHPRTPSPTILFHGSPTPLPLPAGLALTSPGLDQTMALPSWTTNAATDIFADQLPAITRDFPPCASWPSHPPRAHPYAEALTLLHPLASPCVSTGWKGAPHMWIAMGGGERLADAAKVVARDARKDGATVQWVEFESMPHQWVLMFKDWWQGREATKMWAEACRDLVARGKELESRGCIMGVDGREREVDVMTLADLTKEDVMGAMRAKAEGMKIWTGARAASKGAKSQL
ncbi:MAG: hypothetical protein M1830_003870 [Pleopsidium flavum]|nr:MAG: hypothetical protein M1830_003870 [Pleopsidium flavum]